MNSARSQPVVPGGALRPVGSDVCLVQGRVKTDLPQGTQVGRMATAFHFITKKKEEGQVTHCPCFSILRKGILPDLSLDLHLR